MSQEVRLEDFVHFVVLYGKKYLMCEGPTSRLEERISHLGSRFSFRTEVFSTPTGIFISATDPAGKTATEIARIRSSSTHLAELARLEELVEGVLQDPSLFFSSWEKLKNSEDFVEEFSFFTRVFFAFLMGWMVSFVRYENLFASLMSGMLAALIYFLGKPIAKKYYLGGTFLDFICSFLALFVSSWLSMWLGVSYELFVLGSLVYLAPGLTITTAVSELAEQNFVSGTAKLMRGILTLLAMGISYVLVMRMSHSWMPSFPPAELVKQTVWVGLGAHFLIVSSFCILLQAPKKTIYYGMMLGLLSWLIFRQFKDPNDFALASYFASLSVGFGGLVLGRIYRVPSQIFSVPGVLSLVPGMLALSSFHSFAAGSHGGGIEIAFRVALIAGSIVFGLFSARIPFVLFQRSDF